MADLIDRAEVADLLGVTTRTAQRYAARDDFPEPAKRIGRIGLWDRKAIERWGKTHLPLPRSGRPRKG
jgi:predicted DNA-binding transcriptional regulator AlpA